MSTGGDKLNAPILKSKMVLYGDEDFIKTIAQLLNVTRQTASAKLNGESEWTQTEIAIVSKHYGLTDEEVRMIFLEGESSNESERSS